MLKFSLGTLFGVVALVAVGCAAVANASELWAEVMVTLTVIVLFSGFLAALLCHAQARTFAVGFTAAGVVYFLLTFVQAIGLRDHLLTGRAIAWLHALKEESAGAAAAAAATNSGVIRVDDGGTITLSGYGGGMMSGMMPGGSGMTPMGMGGTAVASTSPSSELQDIGHCLWALLLAFLGGALAQGISRAGRAKTGAA